MTRSVAAQSAPRLIPAKASRAGAAESADINGAASTKAHLRAERGELGPQRSVFRANHLHLAAGGGERPAEIEEETRRALQAQAVRGEQHAPRRRDPGAGRDVSMSGATGWAGRWRAAFVSSSARSAAR